MKNNVQIYPSKIVRVPNDRISKIIFNLTEAEYLQIIEQQAPLHVTEMRKHKKFGEIITPIKISLEEADVSITEPLDQFDCAVLSVCISEWEYGNRYTTPAIIYRALTGKVEKGTNAKIRVDQLTAITHSIKKLMRTQLDINFSDACEQLNYNDGVAKKILTNVLPCKQVDYTINGQKTTIIELLSESPLWTVAHLKNDQIISFETALLDMPNQNNSPMLITIKHYVIHRVMEIKAHAKQMTPTITFADVFQKCRLENVDNKTKQRVRKFIEAFFEHLRQNKVINSFQLKKRDTGFHAISFTFPK